MALQLYTVTFTRKQTAVSKHEAKVFATTDLEAKHLVSMRCADFWTLLDLQSQPDRGWLTQGKKYNPKARVESISAL